MKVGEGGKRLDIGVPMPTDGITELLESIKATAVESFEKLDKEIKECKEDIKYVKEKVMKREQIRVSSRFSVVSQAR